MNDSPRTVEVRPAAARSAFGQLAVAVLLSLGGLLFLGALAGKFSPPLGGNCSMGPTCPMNGGRPVADCPMMKARAATPSEPAPPPGVNSGDDPSLHGQCRCEASGSTTAGQVLEALISGEVTAIPPPEQAIVRPTRRRTSPRLQFLAPRNSRGPPAFSRA
jgi:hypothetical protein